MTVVEEGVAPARTAPPQSEPEAGSRTRDAESALRDAESALRAAAVAGDRTAFATLYSRYRDNVYRYLVRRCHGDRHLAEDITQDTFVRALKGLHGYQEMGRPFLAWLLTIAANLLADYWKSGWYRYQVPNADVVGEDGDPRWLMMGDQRGEDPAGEVAVRDHRRRLARILSLAVAGLTERQQQVVQLRYVEGLSIADTALKLGVDEGAVKAASYRARRELARDPLVEALR